MVYGWEINAIIFDKIRHSLYNTCKQEILFTGILFLKVSVVQDSNNLSNLENPC